MSQQSNDDLIASILEHAPTTTSVEVELPSECRVYKLEDPNAPITLRPLTFEDEKAVINSTNSDPINELLDRCLTNVKVHDLLTMDKFYLILKLREISYGEDYNTLLICKESRCGAENPSTLKLSELNVNPVPDDFEDPFTVTLPDIKKDAVLKYPRVRDEKLLANSSDYLDQLWRFVVSIDGVDNRLIIQQVLNKLPLRDIKTIISSLKTPYGVDTNVKFKCSTCNKVSVVDLPLDENFFSVS